MSLESMLDEERKEVLALLEGNPGLRNRGSASSIGSGRAPSPYTPRSPVRSMLDIAENPAPKPSSHGTSNSRPARVPVRSMLDINSPPPAAATTVSASTSPTQSNHRSYHANTQRQQHRSLSDAASRPAEFGPRSNVLEAAKSTKDTPSVAYQFSGYLPSNPGGPLVPKRNTQAGKKASISNAMAEVVRGGDLSGVLGPRDNGRHHSIAGTGITTSNSRSPHNRHGLRSNSPHVSPETSKFTLDNGRTIDSNSAYRRLSDANLALSGGQLSSLSWKGRRRANSGNAIDPLHGGRLEKEYTPFGDDAVDSSDEEHSSDEERTRGRKKTAKGQNSDNLEDHPESKTLGMGRAKGPRTALSLMAAAEEEREHNASLPNNEAYEYYRSGDCRSSK